MRGIKFVQRLFKRRLKRATTDYLKDMSGGLQRHQVQLSQALSEDDRDFITQQCCLVRRNGDSHVQLPLDKVTAHALVLGASGAGKSFFALSLLNQLLEPHGSSSSVSLGLLDPKGRVVRESHPVSLRLSVSPETGRARSLQKEDHHH